MVLCLLMKEVWSMDLYLLLLHTRTLGTYVLFNVKCVIISVPMMYRLFLTMDPNHGEVSPLLVSRAMRNRGIEISLLPEVLY